MLSERGEDEDEPPPASQAVRVEAEDEAQADDVHLLTMRLLRRIFNAGAAAHREHWKSLLCLEKDPGSVGIRKKLKVEQLKTVAKDVPVTFQPKKALGKLDAVRLHALLSIIAEEAECELQKLTAPQMQELARAFYESDEVAPACVLRKQVAKAEVAAVLLSLLKEPSRKFLRYDANNFV